MPGSGTGMVRIWSGGLVGNMNYDQDNVFIGMRQLWGQEQPFGLSPADRRHHAYIIGKTGTGKTSLLRNMIIQDIAAGRGVAVLDPHGDLAEDLLDHIPPWRIDHTVYFNPADREFPIGFNLLAHVSPDQRPLVASGVVSVFKSVWRDSWGPRLEYLLYACVAALCECQNVTLLGVQRMLADERYRQWVVRQITDPMIRSFWTREFAGYDKRFLSEVIAPVQNKVGQLLMAPSIRNILGQVKSRINFRFMMDHQRIFIANLSKGRIGEDKANLLGSLLVTQFQLAALSRADITEQKRDDFQLYVDEFASFCTDSFASILSEARKYRLCLTLSHQYLAQIPRAIRDAVLGNVGTIICFRVSEGDARVLAREIGGGYNAAFLAGLRNFETCVRTMESGDPFITQTLSRLLDHYGCGKHILDRCRQKYSLSRSTTERKLRRWMSR